MLWYCHITFEIKNTLKECIAVCISMDVSLLLISNFEHQLNHCEVYASCKCTTRVVTMQIYPHKPPCLIFPSTSILISLHFKNSLAWNNFQAFFKINHSPCPSTFQTLQLLKPLIYCLFSLSVIRRLECFFNICSIIFCIVSGNIGLPTWFSSFAVQFSPCRLLICNLFIIDL